MKYTRAGTTFWKNGNSVCSFHSKGGSLISLYNYTGKLKRGSLRYGEAVELADVLGYDLVWQQRREVK